MEADPPPTPHPLELRPPGTGGTWEQALRPGPRAGGPRPGSSKEGARSPSPSAAEVGSRPAVACVPSGGLLPWAGMAPSVPRPLWPAKLGPQPPQRLLEGAGFLLPSGLLATTIAPAPSLPPRGSRPGGARPPPRRKNRSRRGPSPRSPAVPKPRLLLSSEPWDEELLETEDASGSRRGGRPPAWGTWGRGAVLGRRPRSARRVSDGLVVTHVPDLRGEGEMLSVRPPVGLSQGRVPPAPRLH